MHASETTCWTMIRGAAAGRAPDRDEFSRRYSPVIRAYLAARWRGSTLVGEIDDAEQEVFIDCFKDGGALGRANPERPFRAFLYGVVKHVAQRFERARQKAGQPLDDDTPARERSLSAEFDRAWASALMRQAARAQAEAAKQKGGDAELRVKLLRLRFQDNLPIRDIAKSWNEDAAHLHH
jgi:DNA-directed RNA polymerase specialized sigma24 family protein